MHRLNGEVKNIDETGMEQVYLLSRDLRRIKNLYNKILLRELSPLELDQHYEALLLLSTQDRPITQNALAELLRTDKSRVVTVVYELGRKGFIKSESNPADRRENCISLSEKAREVIPFIENAIKKTNELAIKGIKTEKLEAFFKVSEIIERNLLESMGQRH